MTRDEELAAIRDHLERVPRSVGGRPLQPGDEWLERLLHERVRLLAVVDGAKGFAEWHGYEPRLISEALRNALAELETENSW